VLTLLDVLAALYILKVRKPFIYDGEVSHVCPLGHEPLHASGHHRGEKCNTYCA